MYNYSKSIMTDMMKGFNNDGQIVYLMNVEGVPVNVKIPAENEPNKLYHYCSLEAFKSIVNSRAMWLTSLYNMKDKNEVRWFYNLLDTQIQQMHLKKNSSRIARGIREIVRINFDEAYSTSFTVQRDKSSKWEIYGDKQQGICFCINPKRLPITRDLPIRQPQDQDVLTTMSFLKVNYDNNKQKRIIKDLIKLAINKPDEAYIIANYLAKIAYTCKNPSYSEEKEWRILYTPMSTPSAINEKVLNKEYFDISNLKINKGKTYYEFSIIDGFITEIILGSKCSEDEKSIRELLHKNGLSINTSIAIKRSQYFEN